jgi:membrane protease subunit HflK
MAWNEPGGNGKDPWGRRQNEQGPPDLEELAKRMQEKLGGLFGGSRGNGADQNSDEGGGWSPRYIGLIAFVVLLIWSLFGFYTVQPAEQGVELRFGKFTRVTQSGLRWHIPYPIEQVVKVNVEELRAVPHQALMLTQDENLVVVELVVQYRVKDAQAYLFNVRDPDDTLRQATESALREVVGNSRMDDVLTSGRDAAALQTKDFLQQILDRYETGLLVRSVNMQNAQPPEAVQAAFADVIKAREDEERLKNTGEAYSIQVAQEAGGMSDRLRQEAIAYKSQVTALAEGETNRFISVLTEYSKAPEITRQRLYLETMEEVLGSSSKVLLDAGGNSPLLYLPLDKLIGDNSQMPPKSQYNPVRDNATQTGQPGAGGNAMLRPPRTDSRSTDRSSR